MATTPLHVGAARSRVDGPAKVTGAARYAAEFKAADLAYGVVVSSAITRGRVTAIDAAAALAVPGVIQVFTHENRPRTAWLDYNYRDQVAPPGSPFRALHGPEIVFGGQPVALVVAESFELARYGASLIRVTYAEEVPHTDLAAVRDAAYVPPRKRSGIKPPPDPRGDAEGALAAAPVQLRQEYRQAIEHHNPMEPHATTIVYEGDGKLTIHDKIQGVNNTQSYVCSVFNLKPDDVRVISPYIGGAFGSGLRPQYQLFLAVSAALNLKRSVRVVLSRDQMFTLGYRPETIQSVALGADRDGRLQALLHEAVAGTSTFEDYQESVVNWSGLLYHCPNVKLGYKLAKIDTATPADMRAPGAATGVYALEVAMDELADATGIDPLDLRLRNYAERDEGENKDFTSKALREAYAQGAERFGWSRRGRAPRSMREGRELVGWGLATGVWEAYLMKSSARARLALDGTLELACSTADLGTGTYTILSQIGADALGVPLDKVRTLLGDTTLPEAPLAGGSWTAASSGSAVEMACRAVAEQLLGFARRIDDSPLANADLAHVTFADGAIRLASDPSARISLAEAMRAGGVESVEATETVKPSLLTGLRYAAYTHSAVFAEVRVDEDLGVVRVTRVVSAVAAGRILNPKTARSQIMGGVVMGIGAALEEESMLDHTLGRFMNHNLGEYHVPVNADIHDIEVIFVEESDDKVSPIGAKGLGEIGIVGTAAAVANAVFHATGKRIRELPITLDKIIA
ncbi:aldehyde oxidase and xanthine dehydrogenase molybdopterin binding [Methylobacterium sp. 4-46]|uniref:xanthine dehydrogenase family protein molybdopterin-binding subunit n=1 Tax=unclassified Methylobacterium TaxID=2615210 RepID=UPI000152C8F0|nr:MULTISPECIES: xanthine dehydrogenase family protein molybdopterin-binding subunit [Methylobacterium]ACA17110.1 aldehyde oxidase and xanthine dehydrogenase molybdopterin binding [Methylobacterium sp. 4-46]WFT82795.1 xanthine dehydrogenase family protein molybdopterin-binding subunit [Methylobacterium nodulans]